MNIYIFSSNNLTNIWAGVGARKWAVSLKLAKSKGTVTKSTKLVVGSLGLLYCSETHEFTTPFLTTSVPDSTSSIKDVWNEEWGLAFGILPLGTPQRRVPISLMSKELPSVVTSAKKWNKILYVQPTFSFQPSTITSEDWTFIFGKLAK